MHFRILSLLALPALLAPLASACAADNCLRAIIASAFPTRHGTADCSSYFMVTVTPPTITITAAATITTGTTVIQYVTSTNTAHATDTIESHVTITVGTPSTTTTLVPPPAGATEEKKKRQVTIRPTSLPAYASPCSGSVRYSSACSCVGVTPLTVTVPAPSTTVTATSISTSTLTSTLTSTTITTDTVTDQTVTATITDSTQTNTQLTVVTATGFLMQSLDYDVGDTIIVSSSFFGLSSSPTSQNEAKFQILASNGMLSLTDGSSIYPDASELGNGDAGVYLRHSQTSSPPSCTPSCTIAAGTDLVGCSFTCTDKQGTSRTYAGFRIYNGLLTMPLVGHLPLANTYPITFKAVPLP
ncbi:hypothetical protein TWF694_005156 [Orbilia ellipsospora]|uniref:Uncharacterized protein n=1 Tax=Orbilia ellipsospora TaxID=2528407 RepID=A0AAV9WUR3_9PEZI